MNTMISSKRFDVNVYLLSGNDGNEFYIIPQSTGEFMKFSEYHFSTCSELVEEIKNTKFIKKIENPRPGYITEYEFVDENDITGFVKKFNECGNSNH